MRMHICIFMKTQEIITRVKLNMSIFSSCVLFLCAGDERNGHKATWEHLLRVTINIPLTLFIFFSTFTPQQLWEHLLRVRIKIQLTLFKCLFSFTFTHQQVYLLLLLLSHLNKSIFCRSYFYTEPSLSNWLYQAAEFLQRRGRGLRLLTSCWGLFQSKSARAGD